jgi:3',5'-cyclic AMP phosphodiesterase CpdA
MACIVVISDVHLSPTHGFFWENWCVARDFANATRADAVIVNGDLAINGPDSDAEMVFAAAALAQLNGRVMALPGNHDVGDEPPGQDSRQLINASRLARWDRCFGADRWTAQCGEWSCVGVNAQLFGSNLAREVEQDAWLDAQLADAKGQHIALFLHKPLFLEDPSDDVAGPRCIVPRARARLLRKLQHSRVGVIVSGHLHQHRDRTLDGLRHIWVPAVAFAASQPLGGDARCGLVVLDCTGDRVAVAVARPAGLVSHDLAAIKGNGRYSFLRDMPPSPPPVAVPHPSPPQRR